MPIAHIFLALMVAIIWGINFLFVEVSLKEFPPLLLCATRFTLASIPAIFFFKLPAVPFRLVATYGLFMFGLQFLLLFMGMYLGMTAGMASIIAQVQVFFSLFFAAIFIGEKPHSWQIIGALISFVGIGIVGLHFDQNVTFFGTCFILAAAATWGAGNLITKKAPPINMMALVVWGSFVAAVPMDLLSLLIEGPKSMIACYLHVSWHGIVAVLYIVYASTWIGYGVWNWLLSRYPVGMVVPYTLLVPIVGLTSSILILGEPFALWKLYASLLVLIGLAINVFGSRIFLTKTELKYE